ncbi:MAG: hypothetical protein NZM28_01420, partial [Fimbriimonadales bacterium]|nr:hypothetical protein [Fimbriimonadales bacterium]
RLETLSQSQGKTIEQVMREAIMPLVSPPAPQHLRRYRRIRLATPSERSRLRQTALREIENIHKQIGEPTYSDSSQLIRELRDS